MYWYEKSAVYHIYPLGYLGCPKDNDYTLVSPSPILKIIDHIPEISRLGFDTLYIGPLFESVRHAYDTVDYFKVDSRLGTNEDFAAVCKALHKAGIKVVLDGVFNHVGRDFWAFKDVREHKFSSKYKDWFSIHDGESNYGDGFWYEGWEGHYELVKLNLYNGDVKQHLKDAVSAWIKEFDIDGLRLDVAYCLELGFLRELRTHCKTIKADFWLMGETLHGDYNRWANPEMLDSVTNYECYKGLYSSFNDYNMFEIAHSLNRQFGPNGQGIYSGKKFYCFLDNHDVTRVASILKNPKHLYPLYALLMTMPGVPGVYYGSEYGALGDKKDGDDALRPEFSADFKKAGNNILSREISLLTRMHRFSNALADGVYKVLQLNNKQFAFARERDGEQVITLLNADSEPYTFNLNIDGEFVDVITGRSISHPFYVEGYSAAVVTDKVDLVRRVYADLYGEKPAPKPTRAEVKELEKPPVIADTSVSFFGDSLFSLGKGGDHSAIPVPPSRPVQSGGRYDFENEYNPAGGRAQHKKSFVDTIKDIISPKKEKEEPEQKAAPEESAPAPAPVPAPAPEPNPVPEKDIAQEWHAWDSFVIDEPLKATKETEQTEQPAPKKPKRHQVKIKAVLFDMDGTVLDTEPIHMRAWKQAFADENLPISDEQYKQFIGMSERLMMRLFVQTYKDCDLVDDCVTIFYKLRYKAALYCAQYKAEGIPVKQGYAELASALSEAGVKSYIVTSSYGLSARSDLEKAGILKNFSGILGSDDTDANKPSPEPYEKAYGLAQKQIRSLSKQECLIVEDSTNGLLSAHAAGIAAVYIRDMIDADPAAVKNAEYRFKDLSQVCDIID
ncbi:hypothetical protein FACS1894120_0040 [Clostridia bacterium]|nr:hypothetical protein FACS1894120_0040 [Clostridia bacterium]